MNQEEINKLVDNNKIILCFDIDGTLSELEIKDGILTKAKPNKKMVDILRDRYNKGNYIILYTGRPFYKKEDTVEWLKINNIPYHEIQFDKPKAHIYIDDSTVPAKEYIKNPDKWDKHYKDIGDYINKLVRQGGLY